MAGSQLGRALWLLVPVNSLALALGLAVVLGTVPLTTAPAAWDLAFPPATPAESVTVSTPPTPQATTPPPTTAPTPAASPAPRHTAPAAEPAPRQQPRHAQRSRPPARTFEQEMHRQIARIPLYQPGLAKWVVVDDLAVYGVTRLRTNTIYLSPRIPRKLLYSVVVHEWGHVVSTAAYGGNLRASQAAFKKWFGGGSMRLATERAADCIATLLGARWTHYTSCRSEHWRLGALYLANGMRLPDRS